MDVETFLGKCFVERYEVGVQTEEDLDKLQAWAEVSMEAMLAEGIIEMASVDGSDKRNVQLVVAVGQEDVGSARGVAQEHEGQAEGGSVGTAGSAAQRRKGSPAGGGERARVAQRSGRGSEETPARGRVLRRTDACLMPPTFEDFDRWGSNALWRGDVDDSVDWLTMGMARVGLGESDPDSSVRAAESQGASRASADMDVVENLVDDLARSHIGVATGGVEGELGSAKRRRTDAAVEEWRMYTPSEIDTTKCMARTWGNGSGGQCRYKPDAGSRFCAGHKKKEGMRGWHGAVDGEIPAEKLAEFRARGQPRVLDVEIGSRGGGRADGAGSAGSAGWPAHEESGVGAGQTGMAGLHRAAGPEVASRAGGPHIVSGFGRERIEDVASHGQRLEGEALARAASRRAEGSRGRMTGFDGGDLDRAAGGPWQAGRR